MEPPQIRVDPESCKRCGFCASVCPSHVFRWEKGEVPSIEGVDLCCVCGHCVAVCAGGAITHSLLDPSAFKKLDETAPIATNRLVDFVWSRRSVRAYKKRDVPRELLERAAQAAGFAPTGSFGHEGRVRQVVIVSGAETMGEIAAITARYMEKLRDVLDSFVVKTVARFSDEARAGRMTLPDIAMRLARWEAGENAITYDAPAAIFVHTAQGTTTPHEDVDAALMNILLTCHALGLGTCWN
ncbi:MAG: nitroreductase family protein, partial [Deltaproteobacteria bacterium]|nr:nitroreductase family protein [Deltaproteobacteria bacterium]